MTWILHRCARCGRKIKSGNERMLYGGYYGKACYQKILRMHVEFEAAMHKKAKHG
jgi:predicted  nucleic acid-binding Zn-ribbon protein